MERTMTTYTAGNATNSGNNLKEKMVTMINAVRAKAASILSRLRKEEALGYTDGSYNLEKQIATTRANIGVYAQPQMLR